MSDAPVVAAPVVAPVTPSAPTPTNGATGTVKPPPKPSGGPVKGPDGRFVPKAAQVEASGSSEGEPVDPPAPEPEKEEEELYELNVGGKVQKLTKAQVLLRAQKAEAADRRFMEAAEKIKKAEELIAAYEADPEAAYARAGKDPAKVLEAHLAKKAREATLTPEQLETEKLKRELDEYKSKFEKVETEKRTAAQQAMDEKTFTQLETTLLGAAEQYGLDKNPQTLEQLCDIALELIEYDIKPTADQICQELIHRQKEHIQARDAKVLSKLSDEKLVEYLGQDVIDRLNKASLKNVPGPGQSTKPKEPPREKTPAKGYLSETEFEKSLGLRK